MYVLFVFMCNLNSRKKKARNTETNVKIANVSHASMLVMMVPYFALDLFTLCVLHVHDNIRIIIIYIYIV